MLLPLLNCNHNFIFSEKFEVIIFSLFQKLRDIQEWEGFSSYYIKTMFLWKTEDKGKAYWQKGLGETLLEMLEEMKKYLLEQKSLRFFWAEELDLLSQLKTEEKQNIGGFLDNMIKDVTKNLDKPGYIKKYFRRPDRLQPCKETSDNQDTEDDSYIEMINNIAFEEDNWDSPIASSNYSYRTVRDNSQALARPQEVDTGAVVAAVAVGAAAIAAVGLFALFGASRRSRQ